MERRKANRLEKARLAAQAKARIVETPSSVGQEQHSQAEPQRNPQRGKSKLGSTYEPAGGLVPWVFGVGMGAALNCLSTDPRILYLSCITIGTWLLWVLWPRWIVTGITFVLLFAGTHRLVLVKQAQALAQDTESSISVSPSAGTDSKSPLDTDFEIFNSGSFTLTNILFGIRVVEAKAGGTTLNNFLAPSPFKVDRLSPGGRTIVKTGSYHWIRGMIDHAVIEIHTEFSDIRRPDLRIVRNFHFWLKHGSDGPRWLPIQK